MGCFSYICTVGEKGISGENGGEPVVLLLIKDGVPVEMLQGNYDNYGGVHRNWSEDDGESLRFNGESLDLEMNGSMYDGVVAISTYGRSEGNQPNLDIFIEQCQSGESLIQSESDEQQGNHIYNFNFRRESGTPRS